MNCMKRKIINTVGWCGVVAILLAYALVNFDVLATKNVAYQLLNLFGALFIVIEAGYKKDAQPAALNLIWLGVALVALLRML
jgi:hypothetical protein